LQLFPGEAGNGAEQRVRKLASDRRADLCHMSHRCQTVEPRHQRVVQGRRDRERRQRAVEDVAVRFLAQQAAL
jgi:hypothetical protein